MHYSLKTLLFVAMCITIAQSFPVPQKIGVASTHYNTFSVDNAYGIISATPAGAAVCVDVDNEEGKSPNPDIALAYCV